MGEVYWAAPLGTRRSATLLWEQALGVAVSVDAAVHFISYEPALGDVDFSSVLGRERGRVQWLIYGSESGARAREVPLERARSVIEQCRAAGAFPFIKQVDAQLLQLGRRGKAVKEIGSFPADLRVREWPAGATT